MILGFVLTALLTTVFGNIQLLGGAVAGVAKDFAPMFTNLPMLAIALIGFALALNEYKKSVAHPVVVKDHSQETNEGEIEDDEI